MTVGYPMKTLVLLSQKGGSGKSTIATHLAVCAERNGKSVAIIDIDPQASAYKWSQRRKADGPPVVKATAAQLPGFVKQAKEQQADLVIVDTAGHSDVASSHALQVADIVLIPCRPSVADLDAIEDTIHLVRLTKGKQAAVVLNAAPPRGSLAKDTRETISERITVAPPVLCQRSAYANAWIDGRTVEEYEPQGKATEEIRQLYNWIMKV
jgi:chromosome partitioning protein